MVLNELYICTGEKIAKVLCHKTHKNKYQKTGSINMKCKRIMILEEAMQETSVSMMWAKIKEYKKHA
jgi:hypothetical protein